jgi:hypothetical protein
MQPDCAPLLDDVDPTVCFDLFRPLTFVKTLGLSIELEPFIVVALEEVSDGLVLKFFLEGIFIFGESQVRPASVKVRSHSSLRASTPVAL